jgi:acetylornithine deacetylase/succinyl-diaminopimelate desuccinylase-like protein
LIDKIEEVVKAESKKDNDLGSSSIALTIINCTPGAMCIVPDRCHITFDRRFVPGETSKDCVDQIQKIIDQISKDDPDFRANVKVSIVPRTTYTGLTAEVPNIKEAWKMQKEHSFIKAAAEGLSAVLQPIKYGYWDFGTDLSKVCGTDKKPVVGYSPMQEQYCHRPVDKVRIDYMEKALSGNVSIFIKMVELPKEAFKM